MWHFIPVHAATNCQQLFSVAKWNGALCATQVGAVSLCGGIPKTDKIAVFDYACYPLLKHVYKSFSFSGTDQPKTDEDLAFDGKHTPH